MSTHVAAPPTLDGRAAELVGDLVTWIVARLVGLWRWRKTTAALTIGCVLLGLAIGTDSVLFGMWLAMHGLYRAQLLWGYGMITVSVSVAAWIYAGRDGA